MRYINKLTRIIKKTANKKANKKGFTLLELIICVAVLAILSLYIVNMMSSTSILYKKQTRTSEVQSRTAVVLNTVGDIFKNAKTIAVNEDDSALTINSYDSKETRTKLYFDKSAQKLYIAYSCDSEDESITSSAYLLQDEVSNFSVVPGSKEAEISVTVRKGGRSYTEKAHTYIRNTDTVIETNVDGGWVPLPTEATTTATASA